MATIKVKNDGSYSIVKCWPLTIDGETEHQFSGYRVYEKGQRVFEWAQFRDGEQVPKEIFYLLLLDGDISNDRLVGLNLDIRSVPKNFRSKHIDREYQKHRSQTKTREFRESGFLYRLLETRNQLPQRERRLFLSEAAFLFLGQYMLRAGLLNAAKKKVESAGRRYSQRR